MGRMLLYDLGESVLSQEGDGSIDPQRERQEAQLRERLWFAWKLVVKELKERGIQPDHNLWLTAGLWEDRMQLETTQLLWEARDMEGAKGAREIMMV